ncbi:MAG: hypothetical protein ACRC42_05075 [Mycoplasma sp.]
MKINTNNKELKFKGINFEKDNKYISKIKFSDEIFGNNTINKISDNFNLELNSKKILMFKKNNGNVPYNFFGKICKNEVDELRSSSIVIERTTDAMTDVINPIIVNGIKNRAFYLSNISEWPKVKQWEDDSIETILSNAGGKYEK